MKRISVHTSFYDDFQCIGGECPASCCSDSWSVGVDDETIARWKALPEQESRERLLDSITGTVNDNYNDYQFKTLEHNVCVHLDSEGLCWIHGNLGLDYLPEGCKKYPRRSCHDELVSFDSLSLSCPEVLRLLLSSDDQKQALLVAGTHDKEQSRTEISLDMHIAESLYKLTNESLQQTRFPANVILLHVAHVLAEIGTLSESGELGFDSLDSLCSNSKQKIYDLNLSIKNKKYPVSPEIEGRFWKLIFTVIPGIENFLPAASSNTTDELLDLLKKDEHNEQHFAEISELIRKYRVSFYQHLPANYYSNMRNIVRMKFLNNYFPWNPIEGNVIAAYLHSVIPYALVQLLAWVHVKQCGACSKEELAEIIYQVERKLDHSLYIYKGLANMPELLQIQSYSSCLVNV